ncbi:MAG TPA: hypothetical protein DCW53_05285 [Rikenellaceae bacterium]|nr:hypothetical protein [Rikenellaceae bacterium]
MGRLSRKKAEGIDSLIQAWIKSNRIAAPLNRHLVFSAWDQASGAGRYTVRRYYNDGKLYITLNSSVLRSQLTFQKDFLIEKINAILNGNELFSKDNRQVSYVKELILK